MLIRVQYPDNRFDMVQGFLLDSLIQARRISKFQRSEGWVTIGVDPVRGMNADAPYKGPERREYT
jgi:hypothetical protein